MIITLQTNWKRHNTHTSLCWAIHEVGEDLLQLERAGMHTPGDLTLSNHAVTDLSSLGSNEQIQDKRPFVTIVSHRAATSPCKQGRSQMRFLKGMRGHTVQHIVPGPKEIQIQGIEFRA